MYDKRELLCNLWVLRAPWVTGNFTVQLCQIKSTGLPLPNFFLGEEQPSRIDLCWTVKEIMERVLSVTPFQDFCLDIEYFRPWLYRAFWPRPSPQPMLWHDCHHYFTALGPLQASQTPKWWYLGFSTKIQLACGKDQSQARPVMPAAPSHFQIHLLMQPVLNSHFPAFILHHFHFSFKTLHCSTFNSLRRKVFYSTHYCFYQPNYIPVTSHQLIFHGHILIDINCITSPYLRISQALYHSFHYFAGLADL